MMVNVSHRSPQRMINGKHYDYGRASPSVKVSVDRWLEKLGLEMGSVDHEGKVEVMGVSSHHRVRSLANLSYLKALEKSRPKWPCPLDRDLVQVESAGYQRGFGL